ncbi:hypothetical protein C8D87_114134 [Lentzea atacamensis]|uniref:Uncharacterized protein n=1 Tax=Lentzea atacamensis TaxID=531938 RepID=A0ABX9DZ81_9PSEU|nr:hypothetical protein [Lentzea atacamensis]RAS59522.1 hypothetical protein C8D87_114134 [Lentzea atacamensis]
MQSPFASTRTADSPRIEVDYSRRHVKWGLTGGDVSNRWFARTVPWFDQIGVLDYASSNYPAPQRPTAKTSGPFPVYGDPLIVRPDLASVFWRAGSVLCAAPIRRGRVDFDDATPVWWPRAGADHDELTVIEHNLAQCSALPTVDPPLHVVQVDRSGRLSLSFLLADADGSPVIGPTPRHYQPWINPERLEAAAERGVAGFAAMWEARLGEPSEDGIWRFVPPAEVLDTLTGLGFTVTGAAAEQPGLVAAFDAARGSQWATGWYGGTRLLSLARFERGRYGRDGQYDVHEPGYRRIAADEDDGWYGMLARGDVETLPPARQVRMVSAFRSVTVPAGTVALHEPVLISGPLPVLDHEVNWSASCRRCGVPLSSGEVGEFEFTPYVHELSAFLHHRGPEALWCPAHPSTDRRRPHAPVCQPVERRRHR